MKYFLVILLLSSFCWANTQGICRYQVWHESAYAAVSASAFTGANYLLILAGVEERNRRILAPMVTSLLIVGQRIHDNETGKDHNLRYLSLAGGIVVSLGVMVVF